MRVLSISIDVLSAIVGAAITVMAFILAASVAGNHLLLLRSAGILLFGVVAVHLFPLTPFKKRSRLIGYLVFAFIAVWGFASLYFFAVADDPFRNENELFSKAPFRLACLLSIFPILRFYLRFRSLSSIVNVAPRSTS